MLNGFWQASLSGAFALLVTPPGWSADALKTRVDAGHQVSLSGTGSGNSCSASYQVPAGTRFRVDYVGYYVASTAAYYVYGGAITVSSPQFKTYFPTGPGAFSGTTIWQGGQPVDVVANAGATIIVSVNFYRPDDSATCSFGISGQLVDNRSSEDRRESADSEVQR